MPIGKIDLCSLCLSLSPEQHARLNRLEAADARASDAAKASSASDSASYHTADELWRI